MRHLRLAKCFAQRSLIIYFGLLLWGLNPVLRAQQAAPLQVDVFFKREALLSLIVGALLAAPLVQIIRSARYRANGEPFWNPAVKA